MLLKKDKMNLCVPSFPSEHIRYSNFTQPRTNKKHHPGYCRYRFPAGKNHKQNTGNNAFRNPPLLKKNKIKKTTVPALNAEYNILWTG